MGSASGERRVRVAEAPIYGSDGYDARRTATKRRLHLCRRQRLVVSSRHPYYTAEWRHSHVGGVVSRMQMEVTMPECIANCETCAEACKKCGDACEGMTGMEECVRLCRECEAICRQCIET